MGGGFCEGVEGAEGEFDDGGEVLRGCFSAASSQAVRAVWSTGQAEGGEELLKEEDMLASGVQ